MGHEKHILEGFVLDSSNFGESGRILKILTKDHGVMTVAATGVRELHSKMRGSLDILQLVNFEYVEGREMNRLTGIHEKEKFIEILTTPGKSGGVKRKVLSNIVNFILRTVVGEVKNEKLWENFLEGIRVLSQVSQTSVDLGNFEVIWLIKILVSLGYWEEGKLDDFSEENFSLLEKEENKNRIVEEINKAIKSTHLL